MTTDEMRRLLADLEWSQRDLAAAAKRDASRVHKMARGASPIDDGLAVWLREVHRLLTNPPPPPGRSADGAGDHLPETGQPALSRA